MDSMLENMSLPGDLKKMGGQDLEKAAAEIRQYMIKTVADNGGHLAASLGVVELSLALHRHYNSPVDQIIWDVGHQCYPHKLLTGRWKQFSTLRKYCGLCGFPKPEESEHDPFLTGHSSTSISAALGLAQARDRNGQDNNVIAVIGDGALTGGMSFEALNHAGHIKANLMVILNDNKMSISSNVGSLSAYLGRIRSDPKYSKLKDDFEKFVGRVPLVGERALSYAERIKGGLKYLIVPGMIFEELGFTYFGPIDGHNIKTITNTLKQADQIKGPVLVHVVTEKGKGYHYAEKSPEVFHGIGPFDLNNGLLKKKKSASYTEIFGQTLLKLGRENPKITAITAAMTAGTGLRDFARELPERFFDVGIAEQHAVTMAGAMAAGGMKPVVAIYSTFLQRAYDQILHDVCMQKLPVVFAVDRAGITGEDGETHQGLFDLSFLRNIPNMSIMAPGNENELQHMLFTALEQDNGPVALRYPRDKVEGVTLEAPKAIPWAKSELLKEGRDLLIIAAGTVVNQALQAIERLTWQGLKPALINARFVKPLDEEMIIRWAQKCGRVITLEENVLAGGFGSAILELFEREGFLIPLKRLGINDQFVEHGSRAQLLSSFNLDAEGIYNEALSFIDLKAVEGQT